MITRSYSELIQFDNFEDRLKYLELKGTVGKDTFGYDRYLNQIFYKSNRWRSVRNEVIIRDNGCDLGVDGYEIGDKILIHHMNPLELRDIEEDSEYLLNPEYLICVSHRTHNAIHYGDNRVMLTLPKERRPNDMCPWKQ